MIVCDILLVSAPSKHFNIVGGCANCQNRFSHNVVGTNHLIFRIKSYNQSYKIILVPSVLVIHLPDVILINFL